MPRFGFRSPKRLFCIMPTRSQACFARLAELARSCTTYTRDTLCFTLYYQRHNSKFEEESAAVSRLPPRFRNTYLEDYASLRNRQRPSDPAKAVNVNVMVHLVMVTQPLQLRRPLFILPIDYCRAQRRACLHSFTPHTALLGIMSQNRFYEARFSRSSGPPSHCNLSLPRSP
jgi:hypothetical protein